MWKPTASALPLAGQTLGSEGDNFVIAEWRDPGGTSEKPRLIAPRHLHHHDDEAWYVLEGTLHIAVGSRIVEAHAGSGVLVQRRPPPYLLESRAKSRALSLNNDRQHPSAD